MTPVRPCDGPVGRNTRKRASQTEHPLERTAISSECGRGVTPASCRAGPGTPNDGRGKAQRAGRCATTGGVGSRHGRHGSIAPGFRRRSRIPSGSPQTVVAAVPDIPPRDLRLTAAARLTDPPPSGARSCPSLIPAPTGRLPGAYRQAWPVRLKQLLKSACRACQSASAVVITYCLVCAAQYPSGGDRPGPDALYRSAASVCDRTSTWWPRACATWSASLPKGFRRF